MCTLVILLANALVFSAATASFEEKNRIGILLLVLFVSVCAVTMSKSIMKFKSRAWKFDKAQDIYMKKWEAFKEIFEEQISDTRPAPLPNSETAYSLLEEELANDLELVELAIFTARKLIH
jgi:hypothetical protein